MVRKAKRDWEGLAKKISAGKPIEQASVESGIPQEEVLEWIKGNDPLVQKEDYALRLLAHEAIQEGFEVLKKIAAEGERCDDRMQGSGTYGRDTDLDAAKAMVTMGINLRKILASGARGMSVKRTNPDGSSEQLDLFDSAGPWQFSEGK